MFKKIYECSNDELYTVSRLAWQLCLDNISSFSEYNRKYKEAYVKKCEVAIEEASKLPETKCRSQRVRLIEKAEIALANWERLKRYIINAFPTKEVNARLKSAGEEYYEKAMAYDWNSLQNLLKAGCKFIKAHAGRLKANKNMPEAFYTICVAMRDEIKLLCKEYLKSEAQEPIDAERKIKANNAVYTAVTDMFSDAQKIFAKNETLKKQFVFDELLSFAKRKNFPNPKSTAINTSFIRQAPVSPLNQKYTTPLYAR